MSHQHDMTTNAELAGNITTTSITKNCIVLTTVCFHVKQTCASLHCDGRMRQNNENTNPNGVCSGTFNDCVCYFNAPGK